MSWRDSTPQPVQDDLDGLLNTALDLAQDLLEKHSEFFPFGVTLDEEGGRTIIAGDPGPDDQPASQDVLDALYRGVGVGRDTLRGVAFVSPVVVEGDDAVRVELEHRDAGMGITLYLPYSTQGLPDTLTFGDLVAAPADPRIWT